MKTIEITNANSHKLDLRGLTHNWQPVDDSLIDIFMEFRGPKIMSIVVVQKTGEYEDKDTINDKIELVLRYKVGKLISKADFCKIPWKTFMRLANLVNDLLVFSPMQASADPQLRWKLYNTKGEEISEYVSPQLRKFYEQRGKQV